MRKLFAIILAVLMLTGIALTAHAEEAEFNFQALEALAEKIKANAQGSFGTSENPTYIWRVDMPYPQGRECWLQWTEPQDSPQNGTLDVQIRKEGAGVYFLRWLLGASDYCEVTWYDDQTIPGYYPTSRMEPYKPKRGDDVDYIIDHDYTGREYKKTSQVASCGNAVCPPMAEAVVRANLPKLCGGKIETMAELRRHVAV